jgi:hypothetical protein
MIFVKKNPAEISAHTKCSAEISAENSAEFSAEISVGPMNHNLYELVYDDPGV